MHRTPREDGGARYDGCAMCGERREFLRHTLAALAAIGVSLGMPAGVGALPPAVVADWSAGQARSYPVPAADGVQIDRESQVILVRWEGVVYAFALACPHQNTALRWLERDRRFQCPRHHSKYRPDGAFIEGRATRAMDRYGVRLDGATVVVDLAVLHEQDKEPQAWAAALVRLT